MLRRSSPRLGMPGAMFPACLQGMVLVRTLALQPTTSDAVAPTSRQDYKPKQAWRGPFNLCHSCRRTSSVFKSCRTHIICLCRREFSAQVRNLAAALKADSDGLTGRQDLAALSPWFEAFSRPEGAGRLLRYFWT